LKNQSSLRFPPGGTKFTRNAKLCQERKKGIAKKKAVGYNGEVNQHARFMMSTGYPEQPEAQQQPSPEQAPAPEPTFEQGLEQINQAQEPAQTPSVRQAFAERGYDVSQFQDDSTFVQALEQGLATIPQMQGQMDQMQHAWLAQQQQERSTQYDEPYYAPTPESAPEPQASWNPPEYDPEWDALVTVDQESGQFVPKYKHVNPIVAQKANEYRDYLRKEGQRFWQNPHDFVWDGLNDRVEQMVQSRVSDAVQGIKDRSTAQDFLEENKSIFFQLDAQGNRVTDQNGHEVLTPAGKKMQEYAHRLRSSGVTDPQEIRDLASGLLQRDMLQTGMGYANQQYQQQSLANQQYQQQAQQPVQESALTEPAQNQTFLERGLQGAYHQPNQSGTIDSSERSGIPQNGDSSFLDLAELEMRERGLLPQNG
tara:strand:- start:6933 stop:8201 length:1269 start_codon:yes stop_codon:yes gene_type:complete